MAVNDKEFELANRIMALLVRDEDWANEVAEGNRINPYQELTANDPKKPNNADGDYPQSLLRCVKASNSFFDDDVTFGTHADDFDPAVNQWKETNNWTFKLEITSQTLSAKETSPLAALTRRALRAGGPRLGTPTLEDEGGSPLPAIVGVTSVKMSSETTDEEVTGDDAEDGTRREKTVFTIEIETKDEGLVEQET
jgi:hypothetical protein